MGNIIGEVFDEYVANQINERQFLLGADLKENDNKTLWKFNNSAWVRMVSSVNVNEKKLKELGLSKDYAGSKLAKNFILYNGVSSVTENNGSFTLNPASNNTSSFANNKTLSIKNSYGFGGLEQGLRPMPGIESVKIGYINKGFLAQAEIEITAYNKEQLYILDALFMHPGYTFLIEWGHTRYIDNIRREIINVDPDKLITQPFSTVLKTAPNTTTQYTILASIKNERIKRSGNYDGFFGVVKNFKYTYQPNGTYKITIIAINQGDIIENLKINTLDPQRTKSAQQLAKDEQARKQAVEELDKAYNDIKKYLKPDGTLDPLNPGIIDLAKKESKSATIGISTEKSTEYQRDNLAINPILAQQAAEDQARQAIVARFSNFLISYASEKLKLTGENILADNLTDRYALKSKLNKQLKQWKDGVSKNGDIIGLISIKAKNYEPNEKNEEGKIGKFTDGVLYYVQLRKLLDYIQDNLLIYDKSISNPYLKIDTGDNNYCLHFPKQISANPQVCLIPVKDGEENRKSFDDYRKSLDQQTVDENGQPEWIPIQGTTGKERNPKYKGPTQQNEKDIKYGQLPSLYETADGKKIYVGESFLVNSYLGDLMYINVNLDFIAATANDNIDLRGNLSLINFLKEILLGIQASLGYVNNFEVTYDRETNYLKIYDNNILKYGDRKKNKNQISEFVVNGFENFNLGDAGNFLFGSFIENVSFTTELSNDLSNMVTIASQADTNVLGMDVTGLSRFNEGLTDRIIETKKSSNEINNNGDGLTKEDLSNMLSSAKSIADELWGAFNISESDIDAFMSLNRDIANYYVNNAVKKEEIPSPLIIPFNLSLTMLGLSGMKIYERFNIDTKILPPMFDNNGYNFIIKALSHEITNNKWITILESQVINKEDPSVPDIAISNTQLKSFSKSVIEGLCPVPQGWPKAVAYKSTKLTIAEAATELKRLAPNEKNLQIFTLMVMIQEQGNPIKGFNNNFGGIDITNGGWKYNPEIHDGYVCAKEGGTNEIHAFASFKTKGDSLQFKINTFRNRDFGANDIENTIDLQKYQKRKSVYGTDKGKEYSLNMPKYAAAYFTGWNGFGTMSSILSPNDNGKALKKQYKSEKDYINSRVENLKPIWQTAKTALGYK